MSKITKSFRFTAPLVSRYGDRKGKIQGYATVAGQGYWQSENSEMYDKDYCDFDVEDIYLKVDNMEESSLAAYRLSKSMSWDFADDINDMIYAHLEHVFFPNGKLISEPCKP